MELPKYWTQIFANFLLIKRKYCCNGNHELNYSGASMSEELLYNEVLGITNDFVSPQASNSEIYEKEPQYNEFSL